MKLGGQTLPPPSLHKQPLPPLPQTPPALLCFPDCCRFSENWAGPCDALCGRYCSFKGGGSERILFGFSSPGQTAKQPNSQTAKRPICQNSKQHSRQTAKRSNNQKAKQQNGQTAKQKKVQQSKQTNSQVANQPSNQAVRLLAGWWCNLLPATLARVRKWRSRQSAI